MGKAKSIIILDVYACLRLAAWNEWQAMHRLHAILALNPRRNVRAPREGTAKATRHVVPLDPTATRDGTGFLLQDGGRGARVGANAQKHETNHAEHATGHFGHERSEDARGRVFALPVGVFGLQGRAANNLGQKGGRRRTDLLGRGDKGRNRQGEQRKDHKGKLGHGIWRRKRKGMDQDCYSAEGVYR
jgi:hypothetical protein